MQKLNQVIAVSKSVKTRVNKTVDEIYKQVQKPALFDGFSKTYQPLDEDGDVFPPEQRRVQMVAKDVIAQIADAMGELFDVEATKDNANCNAKSDVMVDGEVVLKQVPVTHLLFLEKQLTDFHTIVGKIPALDSADDWRMDSSSSLYRTEPSKTTKTKKVPKPIVLYPATPEHPAQTQMVAEDINIGHWENTKFSGAMPEPQKKALLSRIEKLRTAVKYAREAANSVDAAPLLEGSKVFSWLLAG